MQSRANAGMVKPSFSIFLNTNAVYHRHFFHRCDTEPDLGGQYLKTGYYRTQN